MGVRSSTRLKSCLASMGMLIAVLAHVTSQQMFAQDVVQTPMYSLQTFAPALADSGPLIDTLNVFRPLSDRSATFRLRGRIEEDSLWSDQSAENRAVYGNLPDTSGLRRARVGAEGNFTDDSRYVAEIDLATGNVVLKDVYIGVGRAQDGGEFKFGHMREPFSLEGGTSSNSFAFMERSAINTLDPARNWGVESRFFGAHENWTAVGGNISIGNRPIRPAIRSRQHDGAYCAWDSVALVRESRRAIDASGSGTFRTIRR